MEDTERMEKNHKATVLGRRQFLSAASMLAMFTGLAGGYGAFAYIAGRFLYPVRSGNKNWLFVTQVKRMKVGDNLLYRLPSGETINITRQGKVGSAEDFIALSSTCPHLGCHVHWEPQHERYFCPCHNGTFDALGKGIGGPPGEAGQSLPRYRLKIEKRLLFIEDLSTSLAYARQQGSIIEPTAVRPQGPGHDPCLLAIRGFAIRRQKQHQRT